MIVLIITQIVMCVRNVYLVPERKTHLGTVFGFELKVEPLNG